MLNQAMPIHQPVLKMDPQLSPSLQIQDIDELLPEGAMSSDAELNRWQQRLLALRRDYERRIHLLDYVQPDSESDSESIPLIDILETEEKERFLDREGGRGYDGRTLPGLESTTVGTMSQRAVIDLTTKRGREDDDTDLPHKRRVMDDDLFAAGSKSMRGRPSLPPAVIDLTESPPLSPTRSTASPSTLALGHSPAQDFVILPCISCGEEYDVSMLAHMTCKHDYCQECLQTLVKNSLQDEALYPPRCCREPFEMDDMRALLTPELISAFHEKKIEFSSSNRLYCSSPMCSTYLFPVNIQGDVAECPKCLVVTCIFCKAGAHRGDFPKDEATQQVLALAARPGWQRCPNCMALVEKSFGCNHMGCRCKSQWC